MRIIELIEQPAMIGRTLTYLPACAIVPAFSPKTRATPAAREPPAALFEHSLRLVGETS